MKDYRSTDALDAAFTRTSGQPYSAKDFLEAGGMGNRLHGWLTASGHIFASYTSHGDLLFKVGLDRRAQGFLDLQQAAMRRYRLVRLSALAHPVVGIGELCVETLHTPTEAQARTLRELRERARGHRLIADGFSDWAHRPA